MELPVSLLNSLSSVKNFQRAPFEQVHQSGEQVTSIRINPTKPVEAQQHWPGTQPVPWTQYGYYLSQRPSFTLDPLLHAGCYYVQEASSMFLEQVLLQHADASQPLKILDLCAAPGGKSTHLLSLVHENSFVVSNEVIKQRANILEENITKWGAAHSIITNNDPKDIARLAGYFDIIVIDAPCSGSGLFRKDPEAISEWSEANVQLCSQRQQRIIADVWPALKAGGLLIYSTCSYSTREDEDILDWLQQNFPVIPLAIQTYPHHGITEVQTGTGMYGYRFWPHLVEGEGLFIAAVQKTGDDTQSLYKAPKQKLQAPGKQEAAIVQTWLQPGNALQLLKHGNDILALPPLLAAELPLLQWALYIKKAGIQCGSIAGNELIPDHALAMSAYVPAHIQLLDMDEATALSYLRRNVFEPVTTLKGWTLARYKGHNLGWMKLLGNRVNNYYPKNYRILMGG